MLMERGNHKSFPVTYSKGSAPAKEGEAALSYLLSEELSLYPGDEISVKVGEKYEKCTITGIYSDITNGGKTAKLFVKHLNNQENVMWRIAYVILKEDVSRKDFIEKYEALGAEAADIAARIEGTYGPTLKQVWQVSVLVKIVSVTIILLVLMMFVRMMIVNERNIISMKKAMGFRSQDIRKSFWKSCIAYILVGIALGTICGCTIGEKICGAALKSLGAEGFKFSRKTHNNRQMSKNIQLSRKRKVVQKSSCYTCLTIYKMFSKRNESLYSFR